MDIATLVLAAQTGDRTAMSQLMHRYWSMVRSIAFACTGNWHDAEDVVQDTFITVFTKLHKLHDEHKFLPWLRTVTRNSARMVMRSKKAMPADQIEKHLADLSATPMLSPEEQLVQRELSQTIHGILQQLKPTYREVVLLKYMSGLSYKEIAQTLTLPESTVTNRLYAAKRELKGKLVTLDMQDYLGHRVVVEQVLDLMDECSRLEKAGQTDKATQVLDQACALAADSPGLHFEIASRLERLFVQSRFDQRLGNRAIAAFTKANELGLEGAKYSDAVAIEPWAAYAEMALVYLHMKDFAAAKQMFDRAKALGQPYDFNEGNWYAAQGRFEEALAFYETLLAEHKEDVYLRSRCLINMASNLSKLQRYKAAIDVYHKVLTAGDPDPANTWYWLAVTYARDGQVTAAISALKQAILLEPSYLSWSQSQGALRELRHTDEYQELVTLFG